MPPRSTAQFAQWSIAHFSALQDYQAMNSYTVDTAMGPLSLVEENGHITKLLWHAQDTGERTQVLETGFSTTGLCRNAGDPKRRDLHLW
jgi:hypothetical protein